jgi:endonuclease/exonuclease/phosphatase family metal-dependent hydrolase
MRDNKVGHRAVILKAGSHGPAVRKLENELKERGLLKGPADGRYDKRTTEAVKRFERRNDRKVDGKVGGWIWNKLGLGDRFEGPKGGGSHPGGGQVHGGNSGTGTSAPNNAGDTGKTGTFRTVTANIKSNPEMPQDKVIHDVRKAAAQGDLIGWQEISPARYFDAIKGLGKDWGHYMPKDGNLRIPVPISWKKSEWDLKDSGFKRTHNGKAGVSPHRYITWVKLKNKETGEEVVRINTHLVSGAWTKSKQDRPTTPWRQEMWKKHMAQLDAMVERFEKQGHKVVVGGDFNRNHHKVLGNDVVYDNKLNVGTHGSSTLDYLMHTRDPELKHIKTQYERRLHSDHDAIVATYRLK